MHHHQAQLVDCHTASDGFVMLSEAKHLTAEQGSEILRKLRMTTRMPLSLPVTVHKAGYDAATGSQATGFAR